MTPYWPRHFHGKHRTQYQRELKAFLPLTFLRLSYACLADPRIQTMPSNMTLSAGFAICSVHLVEIANRQTEVIHTDTDLGKA